MELINQIVLYLEKVTFLSILLCLSLNKQSYLKKNYICRSCYAMLVLSDFKPIKSHYSTQDFFLVARFASKM